MVSVCLRFEVQGSVLAHSTMALLLCQRFEVQGSVLAHSTMAEVDCPSCVTFKEIQA